MGVGKGDRIEGGRGGLLGDYKWVWTWCSMMRIPVVLVLLFFSEPAFYTLFYCCSVLLYCVLLWL